MWVVPDFDMSVLYHDSAAKVAAGARNLTVEEDLVGKAHDTCEAPQVRVALLHGSPEHSEQPDLGV